MIRDLVTERLEAASYPVLGTEVIEREDDEVEIVATLRRQRYLRLNWIQ